MLTLVAAVQPAIESARFDHSLLTADPRSQTVAWFESSVPDGTTVAVLDVRELDHKLALNLFSIADKKTTYHNIDQRASDPTSFAPDGKAVVYSVREKGVDNLWLQPLGGSAYRQLTHFTTERIMRFRFNADGSQMAIERGHYESDAVLLRETSN